MSIPLDTPAKSNERQPGDFQRHPNTGAPYVDHPTETTKAGKPRRVMYGRPSSLGKQIENTTNLQKWSERAVVLGCFLATYGEDQDSYDFADPFKTLYELDDENYNLTDEQARSLLDGIVVEAKRRAQAGLSADRGTHTHGLVEDVDNEADWIERARSGEDLGIPRVAQQALVEAWEAMLAAEGIEILAVETPVVDDAWRQAGTLDRIARLTRDRTFVVAGGELVTLRAGWVGVLDVKTGKLRFDRSGHPDYWHGYAVQIASYAQSVPYDPDTDTRGAWDWEIDQRYGIIAHLDVAAAIEGTAKCRLVLVDLEAGRRAGELCVAARDWEKRRDVFSLVNDNTPIYEIAVTSPAGGDDEAATPTQPGVEPEEATRSASSAPSNRRDALRARKVAMETDAIKTGWHPRFLAEWAAHGIGPESTDDEIEAALDAIEPPFDPDPAPPHGIERPAVAAVAQPAKVASHEVARLLEAIAESDVRAVVNGWLAQANAARCSFDPRGNHLEVNHARTLAAYELARATDGDDEYARLILGHVLAGAAQPSVEVGVAIGHLSVDDARQAIALAKAFGDSVALIFAEDGSPRLDGPIAAVLAAA